MVQTEQFPVSSFRLPVMQDMMDGLRKPEIDIIDLKRVKESPKLPRVNIREADMSATGKECLQRMRLEAERHFAATIPKS